MSHSSVSCVATCSEVTGVWRSTRAATSRSITVPALSNPARYSGRCLPVLGLGSNRQQETKQRVYTNLMFVQRHKGIFIKLWGVLLLSMKCHIMIMLMHHPHHHVTSSSKTRWRRRGQYGGGWGCGAGWTFTPVSSHEQSHLLRNPGEQRESCQV